MAWCGVVADGGHGSNEEHGEEDTYAVVPAVLEAVLLDAEAEGNDGADEEQCAGGSAWISGMESAEI